MISADSTDAHGMSEPSTLQQRVAELEQQVSQLQQAQSTFQLILDTFPAAAFWKDTSSVYQGCNAAFARFAGLESPADIVGKSDVDLHWTPDEAQAYRADEQQIMELGIAACHVLEKQQSANGEQIWTDTSKLPLFNAQGEVVGMLGTFEEVAEYNQTEIALRESQQLLQTLFDHLPVAALVKTAADGRFTLWNTASEELFGFAAADVIGKTDYDLFSYEQAAFFRAKDQAVFATGIPETIPVEYVDTPHQGQRILRTIKVPIYTVQGAPHVLLIISVDITEQQLAAEERAKLQAQIIEAQQAALAELSTPLIPISDEVMVMPLIGSMDSRRAQQVMEALLAGVAERRAKTAILDITGVPVVDTQVANALIRAAQAARLLGAEVILTGIRPEVAQTLVGLGVDLNTIITRSSLQSGIAYAARRG
jgi:rsbT co-antagonist protein RsbR